MSSLGSYVYVGADEKFQAIKKIKIPFAGGYPADLIKGFDNQIRNCGAGHDRWELLDNGNILLNVVEPKTGNKKREIEMTKKDLEDHIKQCKKSIWILKTGMFAFLVNTPDFEEKLNNKKIVKIKEIENAAKKFAKDRSFRIKQFELNQERTKLKIAIKYEKQSVPISSQIYFGTAAAYDVLYIEEDDWLHFHVLDILQCVLLFLNKDNLPEVIYDMYDENDELLSHVEFDGAELKKIFTSKEMYEPKPRSGEIPKKQITFYIPIRVPYGFIKLLGVNAMKRADFQKLLEKYGKRNF